MADEETKTEETIATSEEKAEVTQEETKVEEPKVEEKAEEKPEPKPAETKADPKPAPSGKFKDVIEKIEKLTVLELSELVKELEERFGVSAAAPMAMMVGGAGAPAEEVEEKDSFTVVLADAGAQKIAVIKAVREIRQDLGLVEAKTLVEKGGAEVLKDVKKDAAEEAKAKLEAAGAKVELK